MGKLEVVGGLTREREGVGWCGWVFAEVVDCAQKRERLGVVGRWMELVDCAPKRERLVRGLVEGLVGGLELVDCAPKRERSVVWWGFAESVDCAQKRER